MTLVLTFLKAHWKIPAVLLAIALAFGCGRYSKPAEVIETAETDAVEHTVTVTKVVHVTHTVQAQAKVVYIDRYVAPNGAVSERIEEKTDTHTDTTAVSQNDARIVDDKHVTEKTTKVTDDRARVHLSLLVGAQFSPAWQPIPNAGPLAIGVHVEARVIGPVWVGAWALHTGAVGGSIGAEF